MAEILAGIGQAALITLVIIVQIAGMLMLIVNLPGTWVVLGSIIVYGLLTGFASFGWTTIILLAVLGVIGEALEFAASAAGAQRFGASRGGMISAIVGVFPGVILGSMLLPLIGTVIGAFAGAFLGASIWEATHGRTRNEALRAGFGALLGRTGAVIAKMVIALAMSAVFLAALMSSSS